MKKAPAIADPPKTPPRPNVAEKKAEPDSTKNAGVSKTALKEAEKGKAKSSKS